MQTDILPWIIVAVVAALLLAPAVVERFRPGPGRERAKGGDGGLAELSDGKTFYRWFGAPTNHVIVVVHGLTTPHWVFSGLFRGLNMLGYQVLAYDLYGRGRSDNAPGAQTPQFFLRQLTELLDEQGLEGPVGLLGYSMGGVITALFAATYPERVDRLILLAPGGIDYDPIAPLRTYGPMGKTGNWLWHLRGRKALRAAARREAKGPTVIPDLADRMRDETGRRGYLAAVMSAHRETLGLDTEQIHRDLAKLNLPVLAIWGEEDAVIPQSSIGKLAQWNRNVRHHVVKGAGHNLPHAAPNEIIGAITQFFREV